MGPVLVAGMQGLLDQQSAETRTVDEQICLQPFAALQRYAGNESVLGAQPRRR